MLIVGRAVMGIGAAFVMPSTLSILTNVFPARERAKAIALWAGISGSGAAIGPIASGLLLEHFWWGSVFLINLPIIAVALVAGWVFVPKSKDATDSPLDPVGALLSIVGLSALVYAIIEGPHHGWTSVASILWFGLAAVVLVALLRVGAAHPPPDARPAPVPQPPLRRRRRAASRWSSSPCSARSSCSPSTCRASSATRRSGPRCGCCRSRS